MVFLIIKIITLPFFIVLFYITSILDRDNFYDRLEDEEAEDYLDRLTSTSKKDEK